MNNHLSNICRICMREEDSFINISTVDEDFVELKTKLYFCIPTVQIDDTNFPQKLCTTCVDELKTTYNFKNKCLDSTRKIKQILCTNPFNLHENNIKVKDVLSYMPSNTSNSFEISLNVDKTNNENFQNTELSENIEQNQEDSDDSEDDILRDKFENEIEEQYDDDHSYFSKTNENLSENENSCDIDSIVKIKVEGYRNSYENITDEEEHLRESAIEPIFPKLPIQNDDVANCNITVKIENKDDDSESEIVNEIVSENMLIEPEVDPILSVEEDYSIRRDFQVKENPVKYQYFCTICNTGFEENLFIKHSEIHEDLDIISCPSCKREFDPLNMKLFFRHYCPQHNRPFLVTCTKCYRKFKSSQALANHIKIHTEKAKFFWCQHCDSFFHSEQKLNWHMRNGVHTDKITKKLKRS